MERRGIQFCIITTPYDVMKTFEDFERFDGWFNPDYFDYNAVTEFVKKHEDKAIRIGWPQVSGLYPHVQHRRVLREHVRGTGAYQSHAGPLLPGEL